MKPAPACSPRTRASRAERGATLLEALVSILIFSFGILGLVGLQARATQFSVDAEDRNRAALLADDLAAQMRLARTVSLSTAQVEAWEARLADATNQGLPGADADIAVAGNSAVITITWAPPRAASAPSEARRLVTEVVLTNEEAL
jgi:type IV pilus assembly protein PilV